MTWTSFFQAMKSGVTSRVGAITGKRGGPTTVNRTVNQQTRSTSTQVQAMPKKNPEEKPFDQWDFMVLDVSCNLLLSLHEEHKNLLTTHHVVNALLVKFVGVWRALVSTMVMSPFFTILITGS